MTVKNDNNTLLFTDTIQLEKYIKLIKHHSPGNLVK